MFQDQYTKLSADDTKQTLVAFNGAFDGSPFPETAIIMRRPLAFYPGCWFYDVADHQTMPPRRRFLIAQQIDKAAPPKNITILDGTPQSILTLNTSIPLNLNDSTITEYIQFYLAFVRGPEGRMVLIESLDDIPWRDEPSPSARKALAKMIAAIEPTGSVGGNYYTKAQVIFSDGLYEVDIHVFKDGEVIFKEAKMLIEDMPVLDDVLGP